MNKVLTLCILAALGLLALLSGPSTSHSAGATPDPYKPPVAVDTDPDPKVFETTISAQPATVDMNLGRPVHALTFNGSVPGPTIAVNVGDTVVVHYENHLDKPSGIHWHGVEVPNAMDGTPLTQDMVKPGRTFLYRFKVTRPGIFWYHPHHHSSTNQVFKGLYGALIVHDPEENRLNALGILPPASRTIPMVFSDTTVCKAPGSNDELTYNPLLPHVSGSDLPAQTGPTPKDLCETSPVDEDGAPRGPFAAGDIPNIQQAAVDGRTNEGQTVLTNGVNVGGRGGTPASPGFLTGNPKLFNVKTDEQVRMLMVNASTTRYLRLRLTSGQGRHVALMRIGGEGGLLDHPVFEGGLQKRDSSDPHPYDTNYDAGDILLPPGGRADVVAQMRDTDPASPATAGTYTLWTEDFLRSAAGFADIPTVPVAHFLVAQAPPAPAQPLNRLTPLRATPVEQLAKTADAPLDPAAFTSAKPGLASPSIAMTTNGTQLGFDGKAGTHDAAGSFLDLPHMASARYVLPGQTLELKVSNVTGTRHPFHLHGFSIQPIELTKSGFPTYSWPYLEFVDTVDIPLGYTLRFRVRIDPRPTADDRVSTTGGEAGRWVMHCHIFFHAESGMLSELVVVDPASGGHEHPEIGSDTGTVTGIRGHRVTVTGAYGDRDGEQVSFVRPHDLRTGQDLGTITTTGTNSRGTWTWTYDMPAGDTDHIVAIDPVDGSGNNATVFQLRATDAPPSPTPTPSPTRVPAPTPTASPTPAPTRSPADGGTPTPSGGGTGPAADVTAPAIGGLTASRLKTGRARFRLSVSEAARVTVTVRRIRPRPKRLMGRVSRQAAAGRTSLTLRKRLRPGRYTARVIAIDAAGNRSSPITVRFRVRRAGAGRR